MSKYNITVMSENGEPRFLQGDEFLAIAWEYGWNGTRCVTFGDSSIANLAMALSRNDDMYAAALLAITLREAREKEEGENAAN